MLPVCQVALKPGFCPPSKIAFLHADHCSFLQPWLNLIAPRLLIFLCCIIRFWFSVSVNIAVCFFFLSGWSSTQRIAVDTSFHSWLPGLSIWGDRLRLYQTPIFIWVWFASPDYPANYLNHKTIPDFLIQLTSDRSNRSGFQAVDHLHKSYPVPEIRYHHAI